MDDKVGNPDVKATDMIDFRDTDVKVNTCGVCTEPVTNNQKCFNCKLCGKNACSKCFRFKLHDLKACDACVLSSLTTKLSKSPRKTLSSTFEKVQPYDAYKNSLLSTNNLVVFFLDGYCKNIDIKEDFTIQDVARIFSKDKKLAMYEVEDDISSSEGYHLLSSDMLVSELYIRWSSLHWKHGKVIIPLYYDTWQTISTNELSDYSDADEQESSLENDLLDTISQIKKLTRLDSRHGSFRFPKPPVMVSEGTCTEESNVDIMNSDKGTPSSTGINTCDTGSDAILTQPILVESSTMPDLSLSAPNTAIIPTNTELKMYDSIGTAMEVPILCDTSTITESLPVQHSIACSTEIIEYHDRASGSTGGDIGTTTTTTTAAGVQTTSILTDTVACNTNSITTSDAAVDTYPVSCADTGTCMISTINTTTSSTSTVPIETADTGCDAGTLSMQDNSTGMDTTSTLVLTTSTASNTTSIHLQNAETETEDNTITTPVFSTTTTASNTTSIHLQNAVTETEIELADKATSTTVTPTSVVHLETTATTTNMNTSTVEQGSVFTDTDHLNTSNDIIMVNEGTEIDLLLIKPFMCDAACLTDNTLYQESGVNKVNNTIIVNTVDRGSDAFSGFNNSAEGDTSSHLHQDSAGTAEGVTSSYLRRDSLRNHTNTIETMLTLQRSRSTGSTGNRELSPQHSIASPHTKYGEGFQQSSSSKSHITSDHAAATLLPTTTSENATTTTTSSSTCINAITGKNQKDTIRENEFIDLWKPEHEDSQYASPLGTNITGAAHLHLHRTHSPPPVALVRKIIVNSTYSTPRLGSPGTGRNYTTRMSNKLLQVKHDEELKYDHEHEREHSSQQEEGNWELHRSFESNSSEIHRHGSISSTGSVNSGGSSSGVYSRTTRYTTASPVCSGSNSRSRSVTTTPNGLHTGTSPADQQLDRRTPLHLVDGGMKLLPPGHPDWAKSRRFSIEFK